MQSKWLLLAGFVGAMCGALQAASIPYPDPGTIAPEQQFRATATGNVTAYFYGTGALFTEKLGLFVNGVQQGGWALQNHSSTLGEMVNFGPVQAGDTLVFALEVDDTHYTVYSDSALNPDGINHAYAAPYSAVPGTNPMIPSGVYVGFEDSLLSFSDLNYSDEQFVFTNAAEVSTVPEPGTGTLLAGSLIAMATALVLRKRR